MKQLSFKFIVVVALAACGTQRLKVEPVTIQPMHMTIDVNLHDAPARPAPAKP